MLQQTIPSFVNGKIFICRMRYANAIYSEHDRLWNYWKRAAKIRNYSRNKLTGGA